MNKTILFGTVLGALLCFGHFGVAHAGEVQLTPNSNGGGQLPSGYDKVVFTLADGNWTPVITLPASPANGAQVQISSSAGYSASIDTTKVDLPVNPLSLKAGESYLLTFRTDQGKWIPTGTKIGNYSPNQSGAIILDTHPKISFYQMADGNWTGGVTLPKAASPGDIVVVRSSAAYTSKINPDNLLYASTMPIKTGDEYAFVFDEYFKRWLLEAAPQRALTAAQATANMGSPSSPRTLVSFADGNFVPSITLPLTAGNRDRIKLTSSATWTAKITGTNIQLYDSLALNTGDTYEFMYVAELAKWVVMQMPTTEHSAQKLTGGVIPALARPRTKVSFADGNWVKDLYLPIPAPKRHRVVVESSATLSFAVHGIDNTPDQTVPVNTGETIAFVVDDNGKWQRETAIITVLMLYSNKVVARIGEPAAHARLHEGFRLTNEALENSGVNFRIKLVGMSMITAPDTWKALGDPLSALRSDTNAQTLRDRAKADAIYYEGTEEGCGLAWVKASAFNMVATGSLNCGTTVMRHEFGHNMGLNHGVSTENTNGQYAVGYNPVTDAMGGNASPYYSTPLRYTEQYGIPMGVAGQVDGVRAMNEFSATVAAYR
ncbi:MAG TPA: zinc-dependent metalloprotease family protein [Kofleriaceae bacterium]|nr:zinc-dependent metalloprotease family protein [Kofleriaceae bacterium]